MGLSCPWEQFFLKNKFLNIWEQNTRGTLCANQTFFIPLKNSQNVNIESDIAFSIWGYELKVMTKNDFLTWKKVQFNGQNFKFKTKLPWRATRFEN
jgi:hypothetical protein